MSDDAFREASDAIFRFWTVVDEISDLPGPSFFAPGGVLKIGPLTANGREQLASYFSGRREKSSAQSRTTRHAVSNLRSASRGEGREVIDCLVTVFSSYGALPAPLGAPSSVADFSFDCRRQSSGAWLFASVSGRLIFAGEDTPDLKRASGQKGA